jgi:nicotinamide-nucleotide amidase
MEDAPFPDAEIIAVGSELLTPQRTDTNSLYLTGKLNDMGVEVVRKTIVGDDRRRLANVILSALESAKIVILTGGLGPTEDDVTRDAVALALGRGQTFRPEIADWLEQRFARAGRKMAEINKRQAFIIDGAIALPNRNGTAPGQWIEHRDRILMLLPGPPGELKPMFEAECVPRLEARLPKQVIRTRFYRVAGIAESDLDALIAPVYQAYSNPATTILAAPGDIQVHLRARARTEEEAEALLNQISPRIEELLGDRVYSRDGSPIEAVVGAMLRDRGATLAVAESCTGGMLGERITSVAGSSEYFAGGFLTYTDRMKTEVLGIDPALIEQFSAVSEPVAVAMAAAARKRAGASYALSITGIAGPGGGTEATPVGTVFIGFAAPSREEAKRFHFHGDRERVRTFAVQNALEMLRRRLLAAQQSG